MPPAKKASLKVIIKKPAPATNKPGCETGMQGRTLKEIKAQVAATRSQAPLRLTTAELAMFCTQPEEETTPRPSTPTQVVAEVEVHSAPPSQGEEEEPSVQGEYSKGLGKLFQFQVPHIKCFQKREFGYEYPKKCVNSCCFLTSIKPGCKREHFSLLLQLK